MPRSGWILGAFRSRSMIVDANPIVSACLGKSQPLFDMLVAAGAELYVPEHQMREAWLVTDREARRRDRDSAALFAWTAGTLTTVPAEVYVAFEADARARLRSEPRKDWSLIALALASGEEVWSNDVDLFGTGIVVWNTYNIERARRAPPSD